MPSVLTYQEFSEAADGVAAALSCHRRRAQATASAYASSRARSTSTWRSWAVLAAGAAYVPVDADDPDERARLVFGEADVAAVVGNGLRGRRPTASR